MLPKSGNNFVPQRLPWYVRGLWIPESILRKLAGEGFQVEIINSSSSVNSTKLLFKISDQRVVCYEKSYNKFIVSVSSSYFGSRIEVEVQKKKKRGINKVMKEAAIVPDKNMVREKKKKNISNSLKYFEVPKDAKNSTKMSDSVK